MKRLTNAMVITSLITVVYWAVFSPDAPRAISAPLFQAVLNAHGGREAISSSAAFRAHGVRLVSTLSSNFIERRLSVDVDGGKFRRHSADPLGLRTQVELFDGQAGFYFTSSSGAEQEAPAPQALPIGAGRLRAVKFSVETYGLLHLLRRFADHRAEVISQEILSPRLSKFRIKTSAGEWGVYTDASHIIRKMEIGDKTFQFADYRSVNGLQLPFIERMSVGQRLIYELVFSSIELNPTFPIDHFTPESLTREIAR